MEKKNVDIDKIAAITITMTGADLKNLVNSAGLHAISQKQSCLNQEHLTFAFERLSMGLRRKKSISSDDELMRTAYHEAGHALVGLLTPGSNKLHKITILPVGQALG
jgi:ATP-dependent Zn protease